MKPRRIFVTFALSTILAVSATAHAQITQILDASGDGMGATLSAPEGIAVDAGGTVYVAGGGSENVFKIAPNGTVSLLADLGSATPGQLGVDAAGNVFVQDLNGAFVYKITPAGTVTTVLNPLGDGTNPYDRGAALAVAAGGIAYASGEGCDNPNPGPCPQADLFANVFRISPSALPERVLDNTGNGLLAVPQAEYEALTVDSSGNLYASANVADVVFKVTPSNQTSIVIDPTLAPGFHSPIAVATDAAGNVYVINEVEELYRITPAGVIAQILDTNQSSADFVLSLAAGPAGSVYLAGSESDNVVQLLPDGTTTVIVDAGGDGVHLFEGPQSGALAVDASGVVYVTGGPSANAFKIVPPGPFELSSGEQKCVNALNKGLRKVSRAQAQEILGCVRDEANDALGTMTIEECVAADRRQKVQKAQSKVSTDDARSCGEVSPPFGATGADVVGTAARNAATALARDLFGADMDSAVVANESATQAVATCQASVAKSLTRCADAHLNGFAGCKKAGLKGGIIITPGGIAACITSDPRGRIAKACAPNDGGVRAELDSRCSGVDLPSTFPGRCVAATDSSAVAQCLAEAARCRACRAAKNADALLVDCDTVDDGQDNQSCVPSCGDDMVEGNEACDDGNGVSEDGCSAACEVESCGDGTLQAGLGEGCDDGNLENRDGCSANCIVEFCGDGIANDLPNELCDGADDPLCPGSCQLDCTCLGPITVGSHECRPAPGSVSSYYDSPTGAPIDSSIVDGILDIDCGQVNELTGRASCSCDLAAPLMATGNGLTICLNPTGESCATGEIDCDGGDALDVSLTSEHDIGSCSGHPDCAAQCDAQCTGVGAEAVESRCEGYCTGGANDGLACSDGSDCPGGNCWGWTPDGNTVVHPGACGCHCREVGGNPAGSGGLSCQVAVELVVEQFAPCGDGDEFLRLGRQCMQLTSEETEVTLLETNLGTIGPISVQGTPKACTELGIAGPRNLSLSGSIQTFHGNLAGDVADLFQLVCE